jgi:hypothetical protein
MQNRGGSFVMSANSIWRRSPSVAAYYVSYQIEPLISEKVRATPAAAFIPSERCSFVSGASQITSSYFCSLSRSQEFITARAAAAAERMGGPFYQMYPRDIPAHFAFIKS